MLESQSEEHLMSSQEPLTLLAEGCFVSSGASLMSLSTVSSHFLDMKRLKTLGQEGPEGSSCNVGPVVQKLSNNIAARPLFIRQSGFGSVKPLEFEPWIARQSILSSAVHPLPA
jgi:hypothetical protein